MIIYSLLSHTFDFLPLHIAAIRKFLIPSKIIVVTGPYGPNPGNSAGRMRLRPQDAKRLGVEIIEAPTELLGLFTPVRIGRLMDMILVNARSQSDPHVMILHGDAIPTREMTADELLRGQPVASRAIEIEGRTRILPTWCLMNLPEIPNGWFPSIRNGEPGQWNGLPLSAWSARDAVASDTPGVPFDPVAHLEWCEPGFLHLDKLSVAMPDLHARKLPMLRPIADWLGMSPVDADQIGEEVPLAHLVDSHGKTPRGTPVGKIIQGAVGLTKAALRIDRAPDAIVAGRKAVCGTCPELVTTCGVNNCRKCGCVYRAKIVNASEKCPLGKW